jgi:hypothetical protein
VSGLQALQRVDAALKSKDMSEQANPAKAADANHEAAVQFNKRGLFIGGCPKSGTTLLISLLDSHPQLVVLPEETFYLEGRHHYVALPTNEEKLKRLLEKTNLLWLAKGVFQPEREVKSTDARDYTGFDYKKFSALCEEAAKQPWMNDSLLFSEVIRAYAITLGADWKNCARWIEKSTSNEVRHEAMQELYPDAKLIQLMRDPRAVFSSRKKRQVNRAGVYLKAHRLVREWNRSAREMPRLRRSPEKFMVLRYEDFVQNPKPYLEEICRFAGFNFVESMMKPTRAGTEWRGNSSFQEGFSAINTATVDQWKDYLTPHEVWWIEFHCRKGMELANYKFETTAKFSLGKWLKRLPGESWVGYIRGRRGSLSQMLGLLWECNYPR